MNNNDPPPPPPPLMRSFELTQRGLRNVSFTLRNEGNVCNIEVYRNHDDTRAEYPLHRVMASFNREHLAEMPTGDNVVNVNGTVNGQSVRIEFNHHEFTITPTRKGSKPKSIRNRSKSIRMANKISKKSIKASNSNSKSKSRTRKSRSRSRMRVI